MYVQQTPQSWEQITQSMGLCIIYYLIYISKIQEKTSFYLALATWEVVKTECYNQCVYTPIY